MKPSLVQKLVNAVLLLTPIVGALIASAAVRAAEPVPAVTITASSGVYPLGKESSVTATITDASGSAAGPAGKGSSKVPLRATIRWRVTMP